LLTSDNSVASYESVGSEESFGNNILLTPLNYLLKVITHVSPPVSNVLHLWCICLMQWNVLTMDLKQSLSGHVQEML
jgi:hypothetical protein